MNYHLNIVSFIILISAALLKCHDLHHERTEDGPSVHDANRHQEFDHEVILGSKSAVEEFEDLSPEEAKRRLTGIAALIDINGDQFVDKDELEKWILNSFESLTKEESLERFEDTDTNRDGVVSWEEHAVESFGESSDKRDHDSVANDSKIAQEERELFSKADTDSDGQLNRVEYARLSHPYDFAEMHEVLVNHTLQSKDLDHDGKLSLFEFLENNDDAEMSQEAVVLEKDRFENELDKNKDGYLDKAEVNQWIIPNNENIAKVEAEHLINTCDDDKDKKLSMEEIVEHYETFVGSEATDFGEHLVKYKDEL